MHGRPQRKSLKHVLVDSLLALNNDKMSIKLVSCALRLLGITESIPGPFKPVPPSALSSDTAATLLRDILCGSLGDMDQDRLFKCVVVQTRVLLKYDSRPDCFSMVVLVAHK